MKKVLLIIDDDLGIQKQLKWGVENVEQVEFATDRISGLKKAKLISPQVVLLDLGLPPDETNASEGIAALEELLAFDPHIKVIVVTGNNEKENALKTIDTGAYDFYQKPIELDEINLILQRAFHLAELEDENRRLAKKSLYLDNVIGNSEQLIKAKGLAKKVAGTNISVLLQGESGTGKEVFASYLHEVSGRIDQPFIAINCASIPENLLESELFGYEKGAFTGAIKTTKGKIEHANGGTLFLDEIGDMPLPLQVKLLRFLQEREIERVGGRVSIPVDVRVICATHRNVMQQVEEGNFREDLFYRIGEITINIPALRDRGNDVVLLATHFIDMYCKEHDVQHKRLTDEAKAALMAHRWPGNIRELQNKIKSAVVIAEGTTIGPDDLMLFAALSEEECKLPALKEVREKAECKAIIEAFNYAEGNMSKTAELLNVTRPTLYTLINKYSLGLVKES